MTGVIMGSIVQMVLLLGLLFVDPPHMFNWTGVGLFIASGIFASTLGRLFNFTSIERLGVPLSASIIGSTPLFSTLFAAMFLRETVTGTTLLGTILVVTGIAVARSGGQALNNFRGKDLVLPITSAIFYGASSVTRKAALNILPETTLGAVIGAISSLGAYSIYLILTQRTREIQINYAGSRYFLVNGVVLTLAWLSMFSALIKGKVSVVTTLGGTSPLFAVLLSAILLRGYEELNFRLAVGSFIIVSGAAVITLF